MLLLFFLLIIGLDKNLKDDTQSYPSLLVINFLKDKSKITYDKKSSGNHLSELIKKFSTKILKAIKI